MLEYLFIQLICSISVWVLIKFSIDHQPHPIIRASAHFKLKLQIKLMPIRLLLEE